MVSELPRNGAGKPQDPRIEPVLNLPYAEPDKRWPLDSAIRAFSPYIPGRRPAQHIPPVVGQDRSRQGVMGNAEPGDLSVQFPTIPLVNEIRAALKQWEEDGYPGATDRTRELIAHWKGIQLDDERERHLYYAQLEAALVHIFLQEADAAQEWRDTLSAINRNENYGLNRVAHKMATGAGKTLTMAMLILWQSGNYRENAEDYSNRIVVFTPGIIVRRRLEASLLPNPSGDGASDYGEFGIVPPGDFWEGVLNDTHVRIHNYHRFQRRRTGDALSSVGQKIVNGNRPAGEIKPGSLESPKEVAGRLTGLPLADRTPVFVINDEGHHCHSGESRQNPNVWMQGLIALNRQHPILAVTDMSATPVYFTENAEDPAPFQWVVSDYSIVDAMEAGLVKIPKAPYGTDSRFRDIYQQCVAEEARKKRRSASITFKWTEKDANCQALRDALDLLYAHYAQHYAHWQSIYQEPEGVNNLPDNPVMAIIMNTVNSADNMYRYVTDSGKGKDLFQNRIDPDSGEIVGLPRTIVIHSKISEETEKDDQSDAALKRATRQIAAAYRRHYSFPPDATDNEVLRQALSSVGKPGQPGEHVRCVVSVNMLTEGWDARNVTHILGFRAFKSSLLCEQAAGRALRRVAYDFDDAGRLHPEYAYILGIPFPEITGDSEQPTPPPQPDLPKIKVTPVADRQSIEFPNLSRLQRDDNSPRLTVRLKDQIQGKQTVPAAPELAAEVSPVIGEESYLSADADITQGNFLYKTAASALYRVIQEAQSAGDCADIPVHQTFAQLHSAAVQCAAQGHIQGPANLRQWSNQTADINRVAEWLYGQMEVVNPDADGEQRVAMRAIPSRNRPWFTTRDFRERTVPAENIHPDSGRRHTRKSPISHAVGDSRWESQVAAALDACPLVDRWVRNYGLNWSIPYLADGNRHEYRPDFVAVCPLDSGAELHLVIEVKGQEREYDPIKARWARYWCEAVSQHEDYGQGKVWQYLYFDQDPLIHPIAAAIAEVIAAVNQAQGGSP